MKREVAAFSSGALFSAGLCLSGMTYPSKVLAFLDVAGAWDPSLAFVMAGAVGVAAIAFFLQPRRRAPAFDASFDVPPRQGPIDARLLAGAALFGVGWGLSGLCPGPAVVSLASGQTPAIVFVASMLAGMAIERLLPRLRARGDEAARPAVSA
jgi:hypothetical protein